MRNYLKSDNQTRLKSFSPEFHLDLKLTVYAFLIVIVYHDLCASLYVVVKQGVPQDEVLETLSREIGEAWKPLGRRLKFGEAALKGFHKDNEEYSEKAYQMLLFWKQREGSAATYQVLNDALCHDLVEKTSLAEKFCCK